MAPKQNVITNGNVRSLQNDVSDGARHFARFALCLPIEMYLSALMQTVVASNMFETTWRDTICTDAPTRMLWYPNLCQ